MTTLRLGRRGLAMFLIAVVGCGRQLPMIATQPVSGSLFVQKQAAVGAEITLQPLSSADGEPWSTFGYPRGVVAADGTFRIQTLREGDGAPPGEYALTIIWPVVTAPASEEVRAEASLVDRFGGVYARPAPSTLRVTITDKPVEIPRIDL